MWWTAIPPRDLESSLCTQNSPGAALRSPYLTEEEIKTVSILGATHQKVTWSQESHQPLDSPHPEAALPVLREGLDAAPPAPISSTIGMTCVWFSSHVTEESGPV